jgi:peptide/nickel transport system permease protein
MKNSSAWIIARAAIVILLSGLAGAALVSFSPGFGIDERALDPRLSQQTIAAIQGEYSIQKSPIRFYVHFLRGIFHGEVGRSLVFNQPVGPLIRERLPATIQSVTLGLALGWSAALLGAIVAALSRRPSASLAAMAFSGTLLSIPAAVLATACLLFRWPPALAIAAVVFPRVFPHAYTQLRAGLAAPHVLMARASGLAPARWFLFYLVPPALLPLVALAGVSVTLAFGASIPIEAIAGLPGIGEMAWRAALGRDLPVLVAITLLLTVVTVVANLAADLLLARLSRTTA